jgi:hypothetical protein
MDTNVKHLEFIQNIITRMNTNSFQIKGMAITIVSAFLAIYAASPKFMFIFFAIFPTFLFWFLDAYYLQQEKKIRGIYNDVAGIPVKNHTPISVLPFEMPINKYNKKNFSYFNALTSKTIIWFYLLIIIVLLGLGCTFKYTNAGQVFQNKKDHIQINNLEYYYPTNR